MKNNLYRILLSIKEHKKDTVLIFLIVFVLTCFTTIFYIFYLSSEQIVKTISDTVETTIQVESEYFKGISNEELKDQLLERGATFDDYKDYLANIINNTLSYREYENVVRSDCVLYSSFYTNNVYSSLDNEPIKYSSVDIETFNNDGYSIIYGRFFDNEENNGGYNYIVARSGQTIINEDGSTKTLDVGDEVILTVNNLTYTYSVIGIYNNSETDSTLSKTPSIYDNDVSFLLPMNDILDIATNTNNLSINNPYIVIKGADTFKEIRKDINKFLTSTKIKGNNGPVNVPFKINVDDSLIESMSKPISEVKALMQIVCLLMIIIMIILLYSLTLYIVNKRRHDFGIFISLGQSKLQTMTQYLFELLTISSLAFIISMPISTKIGNSVSDIMVNASLKRKEKLALFTSNSNEIDEFELSKQAYEGYSLKVSFNDNLAIYVMYVTIIILSSSTSLIVISKIKPKELLKK